ncbi:MAG: hypothetical protein ACFB03_19545 [Paracoccaceae bacterium]
MRYFIFSIYRDIGDPVLGSGWVRAICAQEALDMIGHEDAEVVEIPDDVGFPARAIGPIFWERRAPSLMN